MKPIIQKLPLTENSSFVSRTYRTPNFEVPWHHHVEYELILFTEGSGMSFIGNYIGGFEVGDVFFLGKNLPHTFQKREKDLIASAIVVQFREDCWGMNFFKTDDCSDIRELLAVSEQGLKIEGASQRILAELIQELEQTVGFGRIISLCNCLNTIAFSKDQKILSTGMVRKSDKPNDKIDRIFDFTINSFKRPIGLDEVASLASMSVPAFCNYFKKSTKKTYINFLNEVRIGYACRMLANTGNSVSEVCFDSGFQSLQNFNKQFYKLKQVTPSRYRKEALRNAGF